MLPLDFTGPHLGFDRSSVLCSLRLNLRLSHRARMVVVVLDEIRVDR